jgi:hypothetical protein
MWCVVLVLLHLLVTSRESCSLLKLGEQNYCISIGMDTAPATAPGELPVQFVTEAISTAWTEVF